jgi:RNA polymerase sigma-70 factor (ECF subfamily)
MNQATSAHRAGQFAEQRRVSLLAQAKKICRNTADAEDLVQEAIARFIEEFGKVQTLPNERACAAWLVTTLTNLFNDQCRKQRVQSNGARDPLMSAKFSAEQEPSGLPAYEQLTNEQIALAIHSLSPKNRVVFDLHMAGMKYQDIASSLDLKVGTVGKRLHAAREKVRKFLQQFLPPGVH